MNFGNDVFQCGFVVIGFFYQFEYFFWMDFKIDFVDCMYDFFVYVGVQFLCDFVGDVELFGKVF